MSRRKTKKSFNKMNYNNKAQSKQISKLTRQVNSLKAAPERKVVLKARDIITSTSGAMQTPLNVLQQGVTGQTRIADVIKNNFLSFNALVEAVTNPSLYRLILLVDTTNRNSTAPITLAEIFSHNSSLAQSCFSTFNNDNVGKGKRIRILWDSGAVIISPTQGRRSITYKKRIRLGYKTHYNSNIGDGADIIDNCVALFRVFNDTNSKFGFSSKLSFVDS